MTDGSIRLLELATGKEVRKLEVTEYIKCLKFSPDDRLLATGASQRDINPAPGPYAVTLWDVATGTKLRCIPAHIDFVADLAFSPNGRTLASCGTETVIRLWDTTSGNALHASDAPRSAIRSVAISPDGGRVVTGGYDGTIREWDPTTGRQRRLIGRCSETVADLVFTPDGKGLVTGSFDDTCRFWELASGKEVRRYAGTQGWIDYVAVSLDGRSLYAGMEVFDIETGRLRTSFLDRAQNENPGSEPVPGLLTPEGVGIFVKVRERVGLNEVPTKR